MRQWDVPAQSSQSRGLPKGQGKSKGKGTGRFRQNFSQANKRFKPQPQTRLQAVERLSRSTTALSQRTARLVAFLLSQAVVTILCPELAALRNAAAAVVQDSAKPSELQIQRWGCLIKGFSEDPKTLPQHAEVMRNHVSQFPKSSMLEGKVHLCRVKPTFRDAQLYLVQFRVDDSLQTVAVALIETLVKAGGNVSYQQAARSGEERQVADDLAALDSL